MTNSAFLYRYRIFCSSYPANWMACRSQKKYYTATTKFRMPLVLSSPFKPELTQFHSPTCDAQRSHLVIVNSHFGNLPLPIKAPKFWRYSFKLYTDRGWFLNLEVDIWKWDHAVKKFGPPEESFRILDIILSSSFFSKARPNLENQMIDVWKACLACQIMIRWNKRL